MSQLGWLECPSEPPSSTALTVVIILTIFGSDSYRIAGAVEMKKAHLKKLEKAANFLREVYDDLETVVSCRHSSDQLILEGGSWI